MSGAAQLGIPLSADARLTQLLRLLDELDDWNQRMNLTAIRERAQQITKHLLDSLPCIPFCTADLFAISAPVLVFPAFRSRSSMPQLRVHAARFHGEETQVRRHAARLLQLAQRANGAHTRRNLSADERFDFVVSRAVGPSRRSLSGQDIYVSAADDCWQ